MMLFLVCALGGALAYWLGRRAGHAEGRLFERERLLRDYGQTLQNARVGL